MCVRAAACHLAPDGDCGNTSTGFTKQPDRRASPYGEAIQTPLDRRMISWPMLATGLLAVVTSGDRRVDGSRDGGSSMSVPAAGIMFSVVLWAVAATATIQLAADVKRAEASDVASIKPVSTPRVVPDRVSALVSQYQLEGSLSDEFDLDSLFEDADYAKDSCQLVARDFYSWLTHKGEHAYIVRQQPCDFPHLGVAGLRPEIHDVVVIPDGEDRWLVDWAAAQYDVTEWPVIFRFPLGLP